MKYYKMSEKNCFLCCDNNGMAEDATPNKPAFKKCNHLVSVNLLELQIFELELQIKAFKKAKRYSKIVEDE